MPSQLFSAGCSAADGLHPALSCRLANVASAAEIPLQGVTYQYWFNGPDGVAAFNTSKPSDLFELQCADTTTGISSRTESSNMLYLTAGIWYKFSS